MRVGILGGGQLARMLILEGYPLGLEFKVFDSSKDACARNLAPFTCAPYDDQNALSEFVRGLDVVTYEFENIPRWTVQYCAGQVRVHPHTDALVVGQDRLFEKELFSSLGIPSAKYIAVEGEMEMRNACHKIGFPCVVKTRRLGYDGKGQQVVRNAEDMERAIAKLADKLCVVEEYVGFTRELSVIACSATNGDTRFYPCSENQHREGILRLTYAPARNLPNEIQKMAETYAQKIIRKLQYVGVLTVEMFQTDKVLLANEIAPRVHNSGHWTLNGAHVSQFANHLRAICGLPLGDTINRGVSAMINLIGEIPPAAEVLREKHFSLHNYGKAPRPGRKVGHINVTARDSVELQTVLSKSGFVKES